MAVLLLLLAVVGGILVGDLVLENPAADVVTVLQHPISGSSEGQLVAAAAALGLVVGLLVVGAASLRRTRRVRRRQLRAAERELTAQLAKLERENASLREELAHRDRALARSGCGGQARRPRQRLDGLGGRGPGQGPAPAGRPARRAGL
jgi:hypothetical protein